MQTFEMGSGRNFSCSEKWGANAKTMPIWGPKLGEYQKLHDPHQPPPPPITTTSAYGPAVGKENHSHRVHPMRQTCVFHNFLRILLPEEFHADRLYQAFLTMLSL